MAVLNLTQAEADALIVLEKHKVDDERYSFPLGGDSIAVPLQSHDRREYFLLDVSRGRINLIKTKMQTRGRQVVILVRLELNGPPHRNPDDMDIPCPHLHLYREGFGDKWAFPLPEHIFKSSVTDLSGMLENFMQYCNITQPPQIDKVLL